MLRGLANWLAKGKSSARLSAASRMTAKPRVRGVMNWVDFSDFSMTSSVARRLSWS